MKINSKIIGLLVLSFFVLSAIFYFTSISTLQQSKTESIALFKEEFIELGRELFDSSSNLFFYYLDAQNKINDENQTKTQAILNFIKETDPQGKNVVVINISDKRFLEGYNNLGIATLLDQPTIEKYLQENVINQKTDFDLDNFNEFSLDTTNTVIPNKIHLRIYNDAGLIVGYNKTFATVRIRVQFIERQNEALLKSYFVSSLVIFIGVALIVVTIMIIFMRNIVVKPLKTMVFGLEQVEEGKLETKLDIRNKDEMGEIAVAFNSMTNNLRRSREELESFAKNLEEKVKERTAELNVKLEELARSNLDLGNAKMAVTNLLEDARALEADLRKERDRVQAIVASMGEGLIVVDKENRILFVNPAAEGFLETSSEKLLNRDITEAILLYRGDKRVARENRPAVVAGKTGQVIISKLEDDFYIQTSSGRKFPAMFVITPLLGKEFSGTVMLFRDVSEEKQLESAKSSFISVSSHQLRTPLTSMRWFAEMLISGDAGAITQKQKHFVERIYQGTDRMINLVNLLLQIARVEAGRVKIEPKAANLKSITDGVLVTLKTNIHQKSQNVVIYTDPDPFPSIPMDQEIVWQVIQNLISNAIRYSPEKKTITVSIARKGDVVEYSVKDEGIGIPKDQRNRIFEKFFRTENALKFVPEGSGLGLSLVKLLVEGWGGKVWFESEEGKGSTFYFTVPFKGMEPKKGEVGIGV